VRELRVLVDLTPEAPAGAGESAAAARARRRRGQLARAHALMRSAMRSIFDTL